MDEDFEKRQAKLQELLTPLPPVAPADVLERRCVLLEEEMIRTKEKTRDLARRELEFKCKQKQIGADNVFRPPHDKNLRWNLDFRTK